jgi:hypothetical protein
MMMKIKLSCCFLFFYLHSFNLFSQVVTINSLEATVVENGINIYLNVDSRTLLDYNSHEITIEGNQIHLFVCYDVSPFAMHGSHQADYFVPTTTEGVLYQVQVSIVGRVDDLVDEFDTSEPCDFSNPDTTVSAVLNASDFETQKNLVNFYPNPTSGIISIASNTELIESIRFYNAIGQLVKVTNQPEIDLSSFENGIYLALIKMTDHVIQRKIVVRK